jgi:uncharacterized protein (TIGR02646 family)
MIRIDRSRASAPKALQQDGPAHLASAIEPLAASGRLRSDDFDRRIYCSDELRLRLWRMQHGKCCFCERPYEAKHSTVEHFRPKTEASDDVKNKGNKRLGYWWLAYELENLYFCCRNCNTPKGTYFPLEPGAAPLRPRALPWKTPERALLIDPGFEDPEPHITWRWIGPKHGYVPVGVTERGKQMVRAVALDQRDTLRQLRARYYALHIAPVIKRHRNAKARGDSAALAEARDDAQRLAGPTADYAAMARYVFRRARVL